MPRIRTQEADSNPTTLPVQREASTSRRVNVQFKGVQIRTKPCKYANAVYYHRANLNVIYLKDRHKHLAEYLSTLLFMILYEGG